MKSGEYVVAVFYEVCDGYRLAEIPAEHNHSSDLAAAIVMAPFSDVTDGKTGVVGDSIRSEREWTVAMSRCFVNGRRTNKGFLESTERRLDRERPVQMQFRVLSTAATMPAEKRG